MRLAVLRLIGDKQDVYANVEMVICVFPAKNEDDETDNVVDTAGEGSKTRTSVMLIDDTIITVEGGLEHVIAALRAAR